LLGNKDLVGTVLGFKDGSILLLGNWLGCEDGFVLTLGIKLGNTDGSFDTEGARGSTKVTSIPAVLSAAKV
jgi:hypothetical protein